MTLKWCDIPEDLEVTEEQLQRVNAILSRVKYKGIIPEDEEERQLFLEFVEYEVERLKRLAERYRRLRKKKDKPSPFLEDLGQRIARLEVAQELIVIDRDRRWREALSNLECDT